MNIYEHYKNSSGESVFVVKEKRITGDKLSDLKKDISEVQKIRPVSERFLPLKKPHDKFEQWKVSPGSAEDELLDIIADYLSKTLSFIDQWNSFLKNDYSDLHPFFDKERRAMYEKSFAYRLIYNLRNMNTHTHKLPFTRLIKSIESSPEIILERRYFLEVHKGMQPSFRKELEKIEEDSFNLVEVINQSYNVLVELHEKISSKFAERLNQDGLLGAAYRVLKFYNDHQENNGVVGLTEDEFDPIKVKQKDFRQNISLKEIPYNLAYLAALFFKVELTLAGVVTKHINNSFPYERDGTIYRGSELLRYQGVMWVKVSELVFNIGADKSVYSVLYMVDGLPLEAYEGKKQEFDNKKRKEFVSFIR